MCLCSGMVRMRYLRPLSMFDTFVGFRNDGSIGIFSDESIRRLSFDWQKKASVINRCRDCFAFYDTIIGGTTLAVCCHVAIGPHALPYTC